MYDSMCMYICMQSQMYLECQALVHVYRIVRLHLCFCFFIDISRFGHICIVKEEKEVKEQDVIRKVGKSMQKDLSAYALMCHSSILTYLRVFVQDLIPPQRLALSRQIGRPFWQRCC